LLCDSGEVVATAMKEAVREAVPEEVAKEAKSLRKRLCAIEAEYDDSVQRCLGSRLCELALPAL
jgi:hypothetical protein